MKSLWTLRRTSIVPLVIGAMLLAAAAVGAATITGTPGNDTLRGGSGPDKLTGKGGRDNLYGAAGNDVLTGGRGRDRLYGAAGNDALTGGRGNDLLVGGPGADKLSCGAGRDTARGDARDMIAAACEVIKGVPQIPPVPPVTLVPGSYQGETENGNPVFLTVRADRTFSGWQVFNDLPNNCGHSPGGDWLVDTTFSIGNDGTFGARHSFREPERTAAYERGWLNQWDGGIVGQFDTATSISGTFQVDYDLEQRLEHWPPAHIFCSTGRIKWSATLRPPQVAPVTPGSYQGETENGSPVFLTVRADRTFTGWQVIDDLPHNCGYADFYSPGGGLFVDTSFGIRDEGTFDGQRIWDGSIPYEGGELVHWYGRIAGRFDTATSLSGTVVWTYTLQVPFEGGLLPIHCGSYYVRWSATLRS
jgi:hypothetical protein